MKHIQISGTSKFIAGVFAGVVLFSGSAIALNNYVSDNTAEGGYLLCANNKSKAVTFPNKLSCPTGTTALDLGAVVGQAGEDGINGSDGWPGPAGAVGPTGPQGPAGPAGLSSGGKLYWGVSSSSTDIVADGTINSSTAMVRKIMYTLRSTDLPLGYYKLFAHVSGLWADTARTGSLVECYFQGSDNYNSNSGYKWGLDSIERASWNGVAMNPVGDWSTSLESTMYLVCRTSGTLKGLNVEVEATSMTVAGRLP
jgi:hypothetical protein